MWCDKQKNHLNLIFPFGKYFEKTFKFDEENEGRCDQAYLLTSEKKKHLTSEKPIFGP